MRSVAEGQTIYAQCANGMLVVPQKGETRTLRYRQEIPGDFIAGYDALQGKLYTVLTHAPYDRFSRRGNSMAEIDPVTGRNRIVFSRTSQIRGMGDLNFETISGIFSDRYNNSVFFSIWGGTSETGTYQYFPTQETVSKSEMEFGSGEFWRRRGDVLIIHFITFVDFYDIIKGQNLARITRRRNHGRLLNLANLAFACQVGQGAIVQIGAQAYIEPMYYPPGNGAPQKLGIMLFPHSQNPPQIIDALMHERGLLVLTPEGLHLSEGMLRLHNRDDNSL